eukprot:13323685-Alexandrium_andersonii.AAC.1
MRSTWGQLCAVRPWPDRCHRAGRGVLGASPEWPLPCQARPKLLETYRKHRKGCFGYARALSDVFR